MPVGIYNNNNNISDDSKLGSYEAFVIRRHDKRAASPRICMAFFPLRVRDGYSAVFQVADVIALDVRQPGNRRLTAAGIRERRRPAVCEESAVIDKSHTHTHTTTKSFDLNLNLKFFIFVRKV